MECSGHANGAELNKSTGNIAELRIAQAHKATPLGWVCWDSPDRVATHPAIQNEMGASLPRLVLIVFESGALKVSATRRPSTILTDAARLARAMHTWITSALVSEPKVKLGRIQQILIKRLRLERKRYIGTGVFENTDVEEVLAELAQIYPISEPPHPPRQAPEIPYFLRKEREMQFEQPIKPDSLPAIAVAGVAIRQDDDGRYCLNDLHKAAGGENKHRPKYWLENQQTQELVCELEIGGFPPIQSKQGVGTYVCKELVYAYAMWISPKFHLAVIRAFDALVSGQKPDLGAAAVHPEIARAARTAAWRIANEMRQAYLDAMGSARRPEDEELSWERFATLMDRVEEHLLRIGREEGRKRDPMAVAAGMLAWRPEGWRALARY